jgi:hypothetical protein
MRQRSSVFVKTIFMLSRNGLCLLRAIQHITILLILIVSLLAIQNTYAESTNSDLLIDIQKTESRLIKQPNGPFAVMLFDEYAQGKHIGIIYYDQMGSPMDGKWWISERFWQSREWGSDVTSICWSPNGKYLYVGTSRVYGDGGVFRLDLRQKTADRIYPKISIKGSDILSTEILNINRQQDKLAIRVVKEGNVSEVIMLPLE